MSYEKPMVTQRFDMVVMPQDRDASGKLTDNAEDFLKRFMPSSVHRIAPHVPPGQEIRIKIIVEGNLA